MEDNKVSINIIYNINDDIFDYKTILGHIKSSIEYNVTNFLLIEKKIDYDEKIATYSFTADIC